MNAPLSRLERVDLRSIWTSESSGFTPWLALPENLAVLSEAMGVDLELEGREKPVGCFSADILCKDLDSDRWVLIENQLEKTDHSHLGQLLTYAAGLQAVTIVWIAAGFRDEHRAALDWLNQITDDTVRFFGLEVELWRIGTSPAAPKFNIIAKPNDWSRSVAHAARSLEEGEPSETRVLQAKYWAALNLVLDAKSGPVTGHRTPRRDSWMGFSIGRSGFNLAAFMNRQQVAIEEELGFPVEREELPAGIESRISRYLPNVNPEDESEWPLQHEWLANSLNSMHRVLSQRVRDLKADQWEVDGK